MSEPNPRRRRAVLALAVVATGLLTAWLFLLSDTPAKVYLNPLYLDALVLGAGTLLVADAFVEARSARFHAVLFRALVGTAMAVIHVMQFVCDFLRLAARWSW